MKKISFNDKPLSSPAEAYNLMMGGTAAGERIEMIDLSLLFPYPNQPFKPYADEKLQELAGDIAANGILSPLCVRPIEGGYQILAGHNRRNAAELAGLSEIPCIIKEVDDDQAALIVVNTNLNQRDELLPSEKAFAYKVQLEAMKRQAGRPKNNSAQIGRNFEGKESREILAENSGESRNQISRYIRLTKLIPQLLDMVDNKAIPFMAGVEISYLTPDDQDFLFSFVSDNQINTITLKQSQALKEAEQVDEDSLKEIFDLMPKIKDRKGVVGAVSRKVLKKYFQFSIYEDEEIAEILSEALDEYFEKHET